MAEKSEMPTMRRALEPNGDPAWVFRQQGLDQLRERDFESRMAIGNGFLGVRGAPDVGRAASWLSMPRSLALVSWPRNYVAGLFDTPDLDPPVPVLMPAPNWLRLRIRINDVTLRDLNATRTLDLRRGAMISQWKCADPYPDLAIEKLRIASMADRAIGLQLLCLSGLEDGVVVTLEAWFDRANVSLEAIHAENDLGVWRAEQSRIQVAMAAEAFGACVDAADPIAPDAASPAVAADAFRACVLAAWPVTSALACALDAFAACWLAAYPKRAAVAAALDRFLAWADAAEPTIPADRFCWNRVSSDMD